MLKPIKNVPLDYSLCQDTVTVYHREGLTRQVLQGVHYEFTSRREVVDGIARVTRGFLLVIPGYYPIRPGDKVHLGIGPDLQCWEELTPEFCGSLAVVTSVQSRRYQGKTCHIEARG